LYQFGDVSSKELPLFLYLNSENILKQNRFYLKTHTKSLKIKEINQENPENHFNLGIILRFDLDNINKKRFLG
jgi:hypothetical protein